MWEKRAAAGKIYFMMKRSIWVSILFVAVGLSLLLGACNLFLGDLNQDEGWYLYAAKQVASGKLLYRDFMFTQGPALPAVYGLFFPVVEKMGVAGGRLITLLFGFAGTGCAAWLAARSSRKFAGTAALCTWILVGVNVFQSYFTTIVKTYSLCAFFLTAGFAVLSYAGGKRGVIASFFGGLLLALAACTRLSAGIVLPIAGIWLIVNRRKVYPCGQGEDVAPFEFKISNLKRIPAWVSFGLGGGLVLVIGLGTFFILAPENTQFALFGYHAGRSPGGLMQLLALKAGFVSRFVQAYFLFCAGCVLAFVFHRFPHPLRERTDLVCDVRPRLTELIVNANRQGSSFQQSYLSLLWLAGAAVTLVHLAAPFPYDDYQVIVYPVFAAALVAALIPCCPEKQRLRVVLAMLLLATAASFSSPINQNWMIRGRDRVWWKFKETPDLAQLQQVGAQIREQLGNEGLLLTQDTYLAIEAGARVPHGMEMGPFSYYPEMPRDRAEQFNLLNREMMLEMLADAPSPVAAFSGYGLSIRSPQVSELSLSEQGELRTALKFSYTQIKAVSHFGQAHTTLDLFKHR